MIFGLWYQFNFHIFLAVSFCDFSFSPSAAIRLPVGFIICHIVALVRLNNLWINIIWTETRIIWRGTVAILGTKSKGENDGEYIVLLWYYWMVPNASMKKKSWRARLFQFCKEINFCYLV